MEEEAAIVIQHAWIRMQLFRHLMRERASELLEESETRRRYFLLTDARLDGEDGFDTRCVRYDALARRRHLPVLDDVNAWFSVPYD
tara:strand:- start:17 stop:274 length:258 start_codon:yes stop_codon:yes gene_type:complete